MTWSGSDRSYNALYLPLCSDIMGKGDRCKGIGEFYTQGNFHFFMDFSESKKFLQYFKKKEGGGEN